MINFQNLASLQYYADYAKLHKFYLNVPDEDRSLLEILNLQKFNLNGTTTVIAGGSVLSWFNGVGLNKGDIDLWFSSENDYINYYNFLTKELKATYVCESQNAITFSLEYIVYDKNFYRNTLEYPVDPPNIKGTAKRTKANIQLIKNPFRNNLLYLFSTIDFTICKVATDGRFIYMNEDTLQDIEKKLIRITGELKNPIVKRVLKYMVYGYTISNDDMNMVLDFYRRNQESIDSMLGDDDYDF